MVHECASGTFLANQFVLEGHTRVIAVKDSLVEFLKGDLFGLIYRYVWLFIMLV